MKRTVHKSKYFCGHEVSDYGLKNGYLDYRTLSRAFDAVLVNDITKLFYGTINGEYNEVEQVNGFIDNSEKIDDLNEQISELMEQITDDSSEEHDATIYNMIDDLQAQINELEEMQDEQPEIFQYFIISDPGAEILQEYTNDPVYYLPALDCYVWGVTHWGTSWDYVLTDVKVELEEV